MASTVLKLMTCAVFMMQPDKQLFSTRGEFLRTLYQSGASHGYLPRAIADLTCGALQSRGAAHDRAELAELSTMVTTLYRRGAAAAQLSALSHAIQKERRNLELKDGRLQPRRLTYHTEWMRTSRINRGLGWTDCGTIPRLTVMLPPIPVSEERQPNKHRFLPSRMSQDVVTGLWSRLSLDAC